MRPECDQLLVCGGLLRNRRVADDGWRSSNIVIWWLYKRLSENSVSSQWPEHQPTHRGIDESFAGCAEPFVISTEPSVLAEPSEGPLDDPPAGQHTPEHFG
jgi:hypothetical protein